jgi:hypothetical protein
VLSEFFLVIVLFSIVILSLSSIVNLFLFSIAVLFILKIDINYNKNSVLDFLKGF